MLSIKFGGIANLLNISFTPHLPLSTSTTLYLSQNSFHSTQLICHHFNLALFRLLLLGGEACKGRERKMWGRRVDDIDEEELLDDIEKGNTYFV